MGIPPSAGITGDARPSSPLWKDTETQRGPESEETLICLTPEFQDAALSVLSFILESDPDVSGGKGRGQGGHRKAGCATQCAHPCSNARPLLFLSGNC